MLAFHYVSEHFLSLTFPLSLQLTKVFSPFSFLIASEIVLRVRKRAEEAIAWYENITEIIKTGQKIPLDEAKVLTDAGEKLNISCPEHKLLRAALRATRGWLTRVKKCGAANGHAQVAVAVVTGLINEHNAFLVTAMDALSELKQVMCGYCVCRQPYEGLRGNPRMEWSHYLYLLILHNHNIIGITLLPLFRCLPEC